MQGDAKTIASSGPVLPGKHTFTVRDVATLLAVNHKTVRAEIASGGIKSVRLGRVIRIPRAEVLRLLGA